MEPCPESTYAVLAVDEPTKVRCGKLAGHEGWHSFRIEWSGPSQTETIARIGAKPVAA